MPTRVEAADSFVTHMNRSIVKKNNIVRKYQGKRYSIAEALEANNDEHSIWVTVTEEIPCVSLQLFSNTINAFQFAHSIRICTIYLLKKGKF
ncbi:hypothetical protein I7I50_12473 [Histoplasma capsulatum G186AR]|uniref:Uncharacterized protein n=1 Tax=Ajellomyces capsulatus TaxID=5037 RepID=A0A8H8CQY0_AJECA|nr:hypothetical protein I7I52_11220 [Histoplasma capsulatum]QSS70741.1 hypothetical protein I7I50_12473 [Histoplasma capsulatum G186AR]